MRRLAAVFALALASACAPASEREVMSEGCDLRATSVWAAGQAQLSVEAIASGPDCARAVATLVVRNSSGEALFAQAHRAQDVMTLAQARDLAAMAPALAEWVGAEDPAFASSAALPAWAPGADAPTQGEFPFYVAEGVDQQAWEALRAREAPVFCYVQGMESMNCLVADDEAVSSIGLQTLPG